MILKKLFRIWPAATSKDVLLSEVWGYQNMVATHTLETHIYRLRQKIARLTDIPIVETTQEGYRLVKPAHTKLGKLAANRSVASGINKHP